MTPGNPAFGSTVLRIPAEQSPNYVAGVSGWFIGQDGYAEFNDVVIRGGEIVSGTFLLYSGPPAHGNLVASVSGTAGADQYGNDYPAGVGGLLTTSVLNMLSGTIEWTTAGGQQILPVGAGGLKITADPVQLVTSGWADLRPLANSFSGTVSGYYPPQIWLAPDQTVRVFGVVQLPASYLSVTFATAPADLIPDHEVFLDCKVITNSGAAPANSQSPYVTVDTSGDMQFHGLPTGLSGGLVFVNGSYPLDSTGLIES